MKTADLIALGNDTVVYADATNDETDEYGRVLDVADRYATLRVTDIDGNAEERPVSVAEAHGIDTTDRNWRWTVSYMTREHWSRPVVDDFGNVVTTPTERTVSVYVGRIQQTADEIKAEQAAWAAERARREEERARKREQADLVLKSLHDLLPETLATSSYLRAHDADGAFDIYNAIVRDAEITEIQPNVYTVTVPAVDRYGSANDPHEQTILHLVDTDTYAYVGERASFTPASPTLDWGMHSEHVLTIAALLVATR